MTKKLAGKVAFVTGASSGIGEATAVALAEEGARVAVLARRSDRLEQLVKRIKDVGGEAVPLVADVTNEAQLRAAIRQAKEALGRIDILVNNAGVMLLGNIEGADTREWRQMLDINVLAIMLTCHEILPIMKAQGGGHIVNISSVAGRQVKAGYSGYNACYSDSHSFLSLPSCFWLLWHSCPGIQYELHPRSRSTQQPTRRPR